MVPSHDPVESFLNSIYAIESGFRRTAKRIESHWLRSGNEAGNLRFSMRKRKKQQQMQERAEDAENGIGNGGNGTLLDVWIPIKSLAGENGRKGEKLPGNGGARKSGASAQCFDFGLAWSSLLGGIFHAFPAPFKSARSGRAGAVYLDLLDLKLEYDGSNRNCNVEVGDQGKRFKFKKREILPFELAVCCLIDNLVQKLHLFDKREKKVDVESVGPTVSPSSTYQFDGMNGVVGVTKGKLVSIDRLFSSMGFARVGGAPANLMGVNSVENDEGPEPLPGDDNSKEESETRSAQKLTSGLLNIPSNMERLRSSLSTVSFSELLEFFPPLGRSASEHPDKKLLFSVQDFFRYTETEGKRFFDELDRDGDGQVTLEDIEIAMRKRKLPKRYAQDFFRRTRRHMLSKSVGWKQFLSLIKQKDPTILQAYTTLCLSKSGTLQKNQILASLENAGLPANEDNAVAMLRYLVADSEGSISYSHFRNFMLLLPSKRLKEDPRSIWFEAATVVAVPPPVEIAAENVLKSALAGGLASALSTSLLFPVDTMKTRVQASTLSFPEVISKLPEIGLQGLYRGSIPAIIGQFSSHGLRTGIFEASKLLLINVAPSLPEIQVQSLASFCSTFLGTAVRIPCEVLKQRLQAGIFNNVGEAIVGTIQQDGFKGFFRGTGATLCREVPFYVAGMGLYAEAKKVAQNLLSRDLEPWETIAVGALSGGLAAVVTTPFDVLKTRTMTAPQGMPVSMSIIALSILRHEGPLGLFKGAVPRFFWIAPLGAMNFAGYELAKKAMEKPDDISDDVLSEKTTTGSN